MLSNGAFDVETLKSEELLVLKRLKWDLNVATSCCFMESFLSTIFVETELHQKIYHLTDAILVQILSDYDMLQYTPSKRSLAAILIAFACLNADCRIVYQAIAREINTLSTDMSAMGMGLEIPSMLLGSLGNEGIRLGHFHEHRCQY
eukprot:jgi/Hompol1/1272/HPOL_000648-RA